MSDMNRYLNKHLLEFSKQKIILLSGPRQVGKTTLLKALLPKSAYYNYDIKDDLKAFKNNEWDKSTSSVIFDELHKMKNWKLWLKGLFDDGTLKKQQIFVTGSARLDIAKKMGDSLAGRFFSYRLNPFDLKELKGQRTVEENYNRLLECSGFPEPFTNGTKRFYGIWKKTHNDLILRQDLVSFEIVKDLDSLEVLIELLSERVGSTISVHSLAEDLQKDEKTIKRWLTILENLFIIFRINPFSKNISRAILKSGKYYFYDTARVKGDESSKLENIVALSLKKEIEFLSDTEGISLNLNFAKLRDQREIDFIITHDSKPIKLIEVKLNDTNESRNFMAFEKYLKKCEKIQLVRHLNKTFSTKNNVQIRSCLNYLENLNLKP